MIEIDDNKNDCALGERILFTQPMNVHIRYHNDQKKREYKVVTVILTNLGIYIIDDTDYNGNKY